MRTVDFRESSKRDSWRTVSTGSISWVCRSADCCHSGGRWKAGIVRCSSVSGDVTC